MANLRNFQFLLQFFSFLSIFAIFNATNETKLYQSLCLEQCVHLFGSNLTFRVITSRVLAMTFFWFSLFYFCFSTLEIVFLFGYIFFFLIFSHCPKEIEID